MTDKERLIALLLEFGINKSESSHDRNSFIDIQGGNVIVEEFKSDLPWFDSPEYSYFQVSSVQIVVARLRRVEFFFNEDGSFKELG